MMCVPANKQHAKIHGAHSEHKMEKPVAIRYVVFRFCYVHGLQMFEEFFLFKSQDLFLTSIDMTFF